LSLMVWPSASLRELMGSVMGGLFHSAPNAPVATPPN
jgi:hypothetical protein